MGNNRGWLRRLFGRADDGALRTLYDVVVARARSPHWYLAGGVPDTLDGRFDMVATVLALVLLRLEEDPAGVAASARLTERFVDDMDAQVRQIGFGDLVVGKHVGSLVGMLGGRVRAYREALDGGDLDAVLVRNVYRGEPPAAEAMAHVRDALLGLRAELAAIPIARLIEGELP